jgi:hypothetical protein
LHCDEASLHCDGASSLCDDAGLLCDGAGLRCDEADLVFLKENLLSDNGNSGSLEKASVLSAEGAGFNSHGRKAVDSSMSMKFEARRADMTARQLMSHLRRSIDSISGYPRPYGRGY